MAYDDLVFTTLTAGEEPVFHLVIQGPRDGYRAYAASVNTGLEQLIQNDVVLNDNLSLIQSNLNRLPAQSASYTYLYTNMNGMFLSTYWRISATDTVPMLNTNSLSATSNPVYLQIPAGPLTFNIKGFGMYICGGTSLVDVPTTMPTIGLWTRSNSGVGALTQVSTTITDTTVSLAEYLDYHIVSSNVLTQAGVNGNEYFLRITGDDGAVGMRVMKAYMIISI